MGIDATPRDGLPSVVCPECVNALDFWYVLQIIKFYTFHIQSSVFLHSLLFTAKCRKADELFRKGEGAGSVAANLDSMAVVATAEASASDDSGQGDAPPAASER